MVKQFAKRPLSHCRSSKSPTSKDNSKGKEKGNSKEKEKNKRKIHYKCPWTENDDASTKADAGEMAEATEKASNVEAANLEAEQE